MSDVSPYDLDLSGIPGLVGTAPPPETATTPHADPAPEGDTESTRVDDAQAAPGEAEGTDEAQADKTPETPPEPAQAPAKPKELTELQKQTNQFRALARQKKAMEAREAKAAEYERQMAAREARVAQLEQLGNLNDLEILKVVAEHKGQSLNDLVRKSITALAGYQPEPVKEEPPAKIDPKLQAQIEAIAQEARELKQWKMQREAQEAFAQDQAMEASFAQAGLSLITEEAYPNLSVEDPDYIKELYLETANEYAARTGLVPDPADLLEHLNAGLEPVIAKRFERYSQLPRFKQGATTSPVAQATPPVNPGVGSENQSKLTRPTGIVNKVAGGDTGPGHKVDTSDARSRIEAGAQYLRSLEKK